MQEPPSHQTRSSSVVVGSRARAQVYEVAVMDVTLAPEEIQCAVNAALYAHLLPGAGAAGASAGHAHYAAPGHAHPPGGASHHLAKRPRVA